jgi:hypothetical protein
MKLEPAEDAAGNIPDIGELSLPLSTLHASYHIGRIQQTHWSIPSALNRVRISGIRWYQNQV